MVDLGTGEVLKVVDDGVAPIPTADADFDRTTLDEPREVPGPFDVRRPLGSGFELDGYQVRWQTWRFHLRPDQRTGAVLSLVSYQQDPNEASRSVMYQGQLSEIYVPYMDPSFAWYGRNFIDAGEFVAGGLGKPLLPGRDCPDHAVYVDSQRLPDDHPRRSVWVQEPHPAATEHDARLDINLERSTLWRVQSTNRRNVVGYPTSYHLLPGRNTTNLLVPEDYSTRRAGFIEHHLWVTPYRSDERYAAGDHPSLSEPDMGLPTWTKADRPISDTDIVVWHTVGMHHLPRAEDWPVMPVTWHGFELRPFDFFDRNPALDLP